MNILVLNSGSSTLKASLFTLGDVLPEYAPSPAWDAKIEWGNPAKVHVQTSRGTALEEALDSNSRTDSLRFLLETLTGGEAKVLGALSEIHCVGHRVVQGGERYEDPVPVTPEVKAEIARLAEFAPLHNRAELEGIELIRQLLGSVPQVAVFDTAFHRTIPAPAAVYSGPYQWVEQGIRRYGFHGINHKYCAGRAAQLVQRDLRSLKLVTCHLGNGCSLAAIDGGRSIDTTMGFTPLEGLMMGTRSGSVDPGILTYLLRKHQVSGQQLDDMLNKHSGLLGISGVSSDMREIHAAMARGNQRAKLAFEIFVHRLRSCIGSMIAVLGGIDGLVFTAGIGENSAEVRAAACSGLEFLGLRLDSAANSKPTLDCDVAARGSKIHILVIRAQEAWAIARACWELTK